MHTLLLLRKAAVACISVFLAYVIWLVIGNSAILVTFISYLRMAPELRVHSVYPSLYWHSDTVDVVLRFLLVGRFFTKPFPGSGLNRSFSKGLGIAAFLLLVFAVRHVLGLSNYTSLRSIHLALDRSFDFVQAVMILGTLLMARYYGVSTAGMSGE